MERLKYLQQRSGTDSNTFRLGVKEASGCVGAAYSLQFDDKSKSKPALDETVFDEGAYSYRKISNSLRVYSSIMQNLELKW